jgi:1-deoxyxylulose-5-phosphate synthase
VPQIGLGCGTFGREITEADAFVLMDYAVEHGITLFDTAEAYGGGQARARRIQRLGIDDVREVSGEMHSSEKIVGRWIKSRGARDEITLVTKVTRNFRRDSVRAALEGSLARLQTDRVDLYLYHSFDKSVPPEEAGAALDAVVRAGLSRAGGASNYTAAQLKEAVATDRRLGHVGFAAVELSCNLLRTDFEAFEFARSEGLGTLAYSPLAAGFLTGKYTPDRASIPKGTRFDVVPEHTDLYFSERNFAIVTNLHDLARESGIPAVQLALAWVCRHPLVTTVLVGARHTGHLGNALEAARLSITPDCLDRMNSWARAPRP